MAQTVRFRDQLQRNAVALISLAIAITSLGYNTWRNEASEYNRNQRLISIEVLRNVGQLQQVLFHNVWEKDKIDKGNLRTGWVHVLAIKDLTALLDGAAQDSGTALWRVWEAESARLKPHNDSYQSVIEALNAVRADTNALLQSLD